MNKSVARVIEILSIIVILIGLIVIGIGFLNMGQFERTIEQYEVFDISGIGLPGNATFNMEQGHDYRVYVSLSTSGYDPVVSATVKFYINGGLFTEKNMYRRIYSDDDDTDTVDTQIFVTVSPQVDSELIIAFQDALAEEWRIWIYKDLPESLIPESFYDSLFPLILIGGIPTIAGVIVFISFRNRRKWREDDLTNKVVRKVRGDVKPSRSFWDAHWKSTTVITSVGGFPMLSYGLILYEYTDGVVSLLIGFFLTMIGLMAFLHGIGMIDINKVKI